MSERALFKLSDAQRAEDLGFEVWASQFEELARDKGAWHRFDTSAPFTATRSAPDELPERECWTLLVRHLAGVAATLPLQVKDKSPAKLWLKVKTAFGSSSRNMAIVAIVNLLSVTLVEGMTPNDYCQAVQGQVIKVNASTPVEDLILCGIFLRGLPADSNFSNFRTTMMSKSALKFENLCTDFKSHCMTIDLTEYKPVRPSTMQHGLVVPRRNFSDDDIRTMQSWKCSVCGGAGHKASVCPSICLANHPKSIVRKSAAVAATPSLEDRLAYHLSASVAVSDPFSQPDDENNNGSYPISEGSSEDGSEL